MIKKTLIVLVIIFCLILLSFISGVFYIIDETKQVVITQFGKPVGEPITEAGLHFKKPFIQHANYFEKRLLEWDGAPTQIPTRDKKYIWVDTTARWIIVDALKFLQSVQNEMSAHSNLDNVIESGTRVAITNNLLVAAVRNSNRLAESQVTDKKEETVAKEEKIDFIDIGRQQMEKIILEKASKLAPQYGIQIIDVRIKRINYVENVRKKVYERMIAERKRAAEQYRSEGQGKRAEIIGLKEKDLKQITSEAYKKAQIVKGKADAQVTSIYAQAYGQDPDFYSFLKTLQTYKDTIDSNSIILLTTNSEYYKYLKSVE